MDGQHKKVLKALVLEIRHLLEGTYNGEGRWQPGDLEQRLAAIGIRRDREPVPVDELSYLSNEDKRAREVVDAFLTLRHEAGIRHSEAVAEFVRETAYTWANRLLALRCMEARELIDEVILQKEVYGWRSLEHHRLAQRQPLLCAGDDDGLFAALDKTFTEQSERLLLLFDPKAPGITLRPSAAALKRCVALLSGVETVKGEHIVREIFKAPDALGWAYQHWNTEENDRIFGKIQTQSGTKIEGSNIIAATQRYTDTYMVRFLVQNSLGALWMEMHPESKLFEQWEYYIHTVRASAGLQAKPVSELTFLDPACGSGHFLLEAFDLFYRMYQQEDPSADPGMICQSILENNLFGIDIDERAIQISEATLWMKCAEKTHIFECARMNLVASNIVLPKAGDNIHEFLSRHPDCKPLRPALETIFEALEHADQLGTLLQIEKPVEKELAAIRRRLDGQSVMFGPSVKDDLKQWQEQTVSRLKDHFAAEAKTANLAQEFFSRSAGKGFELFDFLARKYDVVAANPPYMGRPNQGKVIRSYLEKQYQIGCDDLWGAFLLRQTELSSSYVAMVHQDALLFVDAFQSLRKDLIQKDVLQLCCHLGAHAFEDITGEKVSVCLSIFNKHNRRNGHDTLFIDIADFDSAQRKAESLADTASDQLEGNRLFKHTLKDFGTLPACRYAYRLSPPALGIFGSAPALVGQEVHVCNGMFTANDARFLRRKHEAPVALRWKPYAKFPKGRGHFDSCIRFCVDWRNNGDVIRHFRQERGQSFTLPGQDFFDRPGIAFPRTGEFHSMILPPHCAFDTETMAGFPEHILPSRLAAYFWAHSTRFILDALEPGFHTSLKVIRLLPLPKELYEQDEELDLHLCNLLTSRQRLVYLTDSEGRTISLRHFLAGEGSFESKLEKAKELAQSSLNEGRMSIEWLDLRLGRIQKLTEVDENTASRLGFKFDRDSWIPDTARSFADIGFANTKFYRSIAEDLFHDMIIELLGYRWAEDIHTTHRVENKTFINEIFPLSEGSNDPVLSRLVGEFMAEEFRNGNPTSVEQEFSKLTGKTLAQWIESDFFEYHIKQSKKRPIAWQVQSRPFARHRKPAFACLIYYHRLSKDTLPKLCTQYVIPLRQRFETEARNLEAIRPDNRSDRQDKRRVELEGLIQELKDFENHLKKISDEGFKSSKLNILANEQLDEWCSADGVKLPPVDHEAFLQQESRFFPNVNDGVRLNIAPLQKAGLLLVDVLAKKDVDKAIEDRAEWRADERRWCRERKLLQPGWWLQSEEFDEKERRLSEWQVSLRNLFQILEKWIRPRMKSFTMSYESLEVQHDGNWKYSVPMLVFRKGHTRLEVRPISHEVLGYKGRVDILGIRGPYPLYLTDEHEWVLAVGAEESLKPLTENLFEQLLRKLIP